MTQAIKAIFGAEPRRENEYPTVYMVGDNGVTHITHTNEHLGTYGIRWYHVWQDEIELARMNALHVETVTLFPPVPEGEGG